MPMRRAVNRTQILKENQREKRGGEGRRGEEDESEMGFGQCVHLCWYEVHLLKRNRSSEWRCFLCNL